MSTVLSPPADDELFHSLLWCLIAVAFTFLQRIAQLDDGNDGVALNDGVCSRVARMIVGQIVSFCADKMVVRCSGAAECWRTHCDGLLAC